MKVFVCLLLHTLACSAIAFNEIQDALAKRALDHRSNIALLNTLSIETNKLSDNVRATATPAINNAAVGNINTSSGTNVGVTYNTGGLGNSLGGAAVSNGLPLLGYAPGLPHGLQFVSNPAVSSLPANPLYFTEGRPIANTIQSIPQVPNTIGTPLINYNTINSLQPIQNGVVNGVQDTRNIAQTFIEPQQLVQLQPNYPVQFIKEVPVPQPYPVHITRTVQVKVPVEVPKPYAVRVPHPVPVPVHIRVPVTVEKPYPVQVTKTIAVPVEKPVYIRVPQPIQVPFAQPYPVGVPQPIQIGVPFVVRLPEGNGETQRPVLTNLEPANPSPIVASGANPALLNNVASNPASSPLPITPSPTVASLTSPPSKNKETDSTKLPANPSPSPNPSLNPVRGNGLLPPPPPPPPPTNQQQKLDEGLLNSYVSSKDGGVFRRSANKYQTVEYQKTW